jgi:acetyl-CoA carboxylase biotin carboxyl carrier protein
MELLKIKQLIDVLAASDLNEIELVEGDHRVRLVRRLSPAAAADDARVKTSTVRGATIGQASHPEQGRPAAKPAQAAFAHHSASESSFVTAPLYGVVHLTPAPGAPVFAKVGDEVPAGYTVCVLEAMKIFHEVKVAQAARITAVLVAAGDEVDAGTPLFRIEAVEATQADV